MGLVAEVLYRFVVYQAVDGFGVGFRILFIHYTPEFETPFGNKKGE